MTDSDILPLGAMEKGDLISFDDSPRRWIVEDVEFSETGITAVRIVPFDVPDVFLSRKTQ